MDIEGLSWNLNQTTTGSTTCPFIQSPSPNCGTDRILIFILQNIHSSFAVLTLLITQANEKDKYSAVMEYCVY